MESVATRKLGGVFRRLHDWGALPAPARVVVDKKPYRVTFSSGFGEREAEAELEAAGVSLPLPHRTLWREAGLLARGTREGAGWLATARDEAGRVAATLFVELTPTRALPLHRIARVERVGAALDLDGLLATLSAVSEATTQRYDVLRLEVATFHRDASVRQKMDEHLGALGLAPVAELRCYRQTAAVDLAPDPAELFAGLHKTARRHIRAIDKNPVTLAPVEPHHAEAVEALVRETRARTGGHYTARPWRRLIELSKAHPESMRWVGLFHDQGGELLAFASGHHHGDYATYADAGSTRRDDVKLPMGYALVWDLIGWAREAGASWFDFGGITEGSHGDGRDPVGGISDFKRYFQGEVVEVSSEWALEPHPLRARMAGVVSDLANRARSMQNEHRAATADHGATAGPRVSDGA